MRAALPKDPAQALHDLISITKDLLDLAHREAGAIALDDVLDFTALQEEKEKLSLSYIHKAQAFRDRVEDFRGGQYRPLLDKLDTLQKELREMTSANNAVIGQSIQRAKAKMKVSNDDKR